MSVRVRLTRVGSKKNAIWRVVVADRRSPRDGRFIEMIGHYNPQTQPSQIVIDRERLQHWLDRGAEPTNTVKKLMRAQDAGGAATAVADEPAAVADSGEEPAAAREDEASEAAPEDEAEAADDAQAQATEEPASDGEAESG